MHKDAQVSWILKIVVSTLYEYLYRPASQELIQSVILLSFFYTATNWIIFFF